MAHLTDLVVHLRLLRRRQVLGDERVRGRGLLLRRQPAAGDDPLARGAVPPRGLEGGARVRRLRPARRRLLRGDRGRARRARRRPRLHPRAVPRGRRGHPAEPLQGDPPPPPAGAQRQRRRRDPPRAGAAGADPRPRRHRARHHRAERRRAAPQGRLGDARAERARPPRGHVRLVRPQVRPGARRRPRARRPLPAQPPLGARAARADGPRQPDRRATWGATGG